MRPNTLKYSLLEWPFKTNNFLYHMCIKYFVMIAMKILLYLYTLNEDYITLKKICFRIAENQIIVQAKRSFTCWGSICDPMQIVCRLLSSYTHCTTNNIFFKHKRHRF